MKTLYISDLDGTLLDRNAEITPKTAEIINSLIDTGMNFSIASARTSETVGHILKELRLNIPIILMNGVCIFDTQTKTFIKAESIPQDSVYNMLNVFKKHNQTGFMYGLDDNKIRTYYENLDAPQRRSFYEERVKKYNKKFTQVESFFDAADKNIVYFSFWDKPEVVAPVYEALKNDPKIHIEYYSDVYVKDFMYLEICSNTASKRKAVEYLRHMYKFDKIVCFGDNHNDLPMLEASDFKIAVGNAKDEVKAKADIVIGKNTDNGVAEWLSVNAERHDQS